MPPKVSVAMITYNHEAFIEQAVRSVLMQETDFEYELVIGEDCSTDRTREILLRLQAEAPDKIRLLLNHDNLGMICNFAHVLEFCKGDYIALLEGDDFWILPDKLQRQANILDTDPGCTLVFHADTMQYEDVYKRDIVVNTPPDEQEIYTFDDLLVRFTGQYFVGTRTVMVRNTHRAIPDWYKKLLSTGEFPFYCYSLQEMGGYLRYIPQFPAATYRLHSGGVWNNPSSEASVKRLAGLVNDYALLDGYLLRKSGQVITRRLVGIEQRLMLVYANEGKYGNAKQLIVKLLGCRDRLVLHIQTLRFWKILARVYFPALYRKVKRIVSEVDSPG